MILLMLVDDETITPPPWRPHPPGPAHWLLLAPQHLLQVAGEDAAAPVIPGLPPAPTRSDEDLPEDEQIAARLVRPLVACVAGSYVQESACFAQPEPHFSAGGRNMLATKMIRSSLVRRACRRVGSRS